jgi:hypothetical protein
MTVTAITEVLPKGHVRFREEELADVWQEAVELLKRHEAEVGPLRGQGKLAPNVKAYHEAARNGFFRVFTARVDGLLVGYCVMGVTPHLHYSGLVWAIEDVIYVDREHRGRIAIRFVKWMDEELFLEADAITRHSTVLKPWGPVLERMHYRPLGTTYIRTK